MSKNYTWVTTRINQAHTAIPSITDKAVTKLELLLKTQMSEEQVSSKGLVDIAKTLLAANAPALPGAEAGNED